MSMLAYGVLVRFPPQTTDCLVIMPYGKHGSDYAAKLELRFDTIRSGAQDAGFIALRLDRQAPGDFLSRLFSLIQSAAIVIADCSLDPDSSRPSPNVMYEIGLAHALGRPTILIKSSEAELPADLRNRDCILFDGDEFSGLIELRHKIFTQITMTKSLLAGAPTHSNYLLQNTSLIKSRHRVCLQEDFLQHFSSLVKFATNVWYQLDLWIMSYLLWRDV